MHVLVIILYILSQIESSDTVIVEATDGEYQMEGAAGRWCGDTWVDRSKFVTRIHINETVSLAKVVTNVCSISYSNVGCCNCMHVLRMEV